MLNLVSSSTKVTQAPICRSGKFYFQLLFFLTSPVNKYLKFKIFKDSQCLKKEM